MSKITSETIRSPQNIFCKDNIDGVISKSIIGDFLACAGFFETPVVGKIRRRVFEGCNANHSGCGIKRFCKASSVLLSEPDLTSCV